MAVVLKQGSRGPLGASANIKDDLNYLKQALK